MNEVEEIIAQIKRLSLSITKENYYAGVHKGYKLLVRLHDLGAEKGTTYQVLQEYHNGLEDEIYEIF